MKNETNNHHRRSIRLKGYDYSQPGAYYVTIVTDQRAHRFGEVVNHEMQLSEVGQIAEACWRAIPEHFPQIELGAFMVMPNHVHGILIFHETVGARDVGEHDDIVGARHGVPLQPIPNLEKFGKPVSGSLATVIRQYKSAVTRQMVQRYGGMPIVWQRNYYEHIIRDEHDHQNIYNYILNNPFNWETDDENLR